MARIDIMFKIAAMTKLDKLPKLVENSKAPN